MYLFVFSIVTITNKDGKDINVTTANENIEQNSLTEIIPINDEAFCSFAIYDNLESQNFENESKSQIYTLQFFMDGGTISCTGFCFVIGTPTYCCFVVIGPHPDTK